MRKRVEPDVLTSQLEGREVSRLSAADERHLSIHFTDGAVLPEERRGVDSLSKCTTERENEGVKNEGVKS
jgi:hypothetical protein